MRFAHRAATLALLVLPVSSASAGHIVAELSGLANPDHLIDFGQSAFPNNTIITTQFAGVTVSHARYFSPGLTNNLAGGFLTNDFSGEPNTFSIVFDHPITDVSFVYHQILTSEASGFRALYNGSVVDSFGNLSDQFQPNCFFGFTDNVFNEVQIDFIGDFNVDTFAIKDLVLGGVSFCSGDGSGTTCPCGLTGAADHGCSNSASANGAQLTGSGSAVVGADTLVLTVTGLPPGQPGLFFQGDTQISGGAGVTFGGGLRCAGGTVFRLGVSTSDAGGNASSTGSLSELGQISPGDVPNYQFWYRDPPGSCSPGSFNLTNGYTVQW